MENIVNKSISLECSLKEDDKESNQDVKDGSRLIFRL